MMYKAFLSSDFGFVVNVALKIGPNAQIWKIRPNSVQVCTDDFF